MDSANIHCNFLNITSKQKLTNTIQNNKIINKQMGKTQTDIGVHAKTVADDVQTLHLSITNLSVQVMHDKYRYNTTDYEYTFHKS